MSASISSSLRLFTTRFPISLNPSKFFISDLKPMKQSLFILYKPISFQKVTTKKPPPPFASAPGATSLQPIEELPPKLQEIVKLFQSVQEPKAKYEQLLFYGKNLKPLDSQFKTRDNKVEGCVSQVWVRAYLDTDRNVVFEADSDSVLTKGLAALLVQGLSGRPVEEVLRVSPDFAVLLGLQQSLTPSRNNGFLNMLKLMQKKALELYVEAEKRNELNLGMGGSEESSIELGNKTVSIQHDIESNAVRNSIDNSVSISEPKAANGGNNDDSDKIGSRGKRIKEILERELKPIELEVEDVSYQHAGHAGVRGSDGETHFNLKVVSQEFEGKSLVKRHRLVYGLLQEELQSGLHALSIVANTPAEVHAR
ncbi:sufE-like protein 1, chloroplastic/mitochondrial [Euphorbia lathyris]|uniref:sufE-like protein 1, chloroplastic/mitochondrial n=1 Tax=Euphorbia lathyris TaxID=212925 RepID=UPI0033143EAB